MGKTKGTSSGKPSVLLDTRVTRGMGASPMIRRLSGHVCSPIGTTCIDPPFKSNRNYEVFRGETKEKRAFEDRHASGGGIK